MKVSVVIPNWNGRSLLEKNLPAIFLAAEYKQNNILEIIIVDDGSTDDSVKFLKENYKDKIKLHVHNQNQGFSSAVNTGFKHAKGELVCLLNTDVIPEKNFLVTVVNYFPDNKLFAVSLHEKGYAWAKGKFENGFIVHLPGKETANTHASFWASGGSAVFAKNVWSKLGGMDESMYSPFYWEDVDICYRALKRGYRILWEPKAHVIHQHESVINTSNFKKWKLVLIKERNYLLFNWKNITSRSMFKKHRHGLFQRLRKHPGYIKVVLLAIVKLPLIINRRRVELIEQTVSDEAIFESFN